MELEDDFSRVDYFLVTDRALVADGPGDASFVEKPVSVGVSGTRVRGIWTAEQLRRGPLYDRALREGKEVIDLGRFPLVPAFVNAHTHLALAPLRGITSLAHRSGNVVTDVFFQLERHLTARDVAVFSKLGAYESLLCGVGEVWDHYYFGEEVAQSLLEVGMSGVVAPTLQDLAGPGAKDWEKQLISTEAILKGRAFAKGEVSAALGPHASDTVSGELFQTIADKSKGWGIPVHLHLAQSAEEMSAAENRFVGGIAREIANTLEDCPVLMAHGLYLRRIECQELASLDWVLAYCPFSQLQFGFLSPLSAWLDAGGAFAIGTDCVASNDALDVQRELGVIGGDAALHASFSSERRTYLMGVDEFASVESKRKRQLGGVDTTTPSALLSAALGQSLGRLVPGRTSGMKPGAVANFLILDPDHPTLFPGEDLARTMAYGSTTGAISWMVAAGKRIGRDGGLVRAVLDSDEYRASLIEARRRRVELFERARIGLVPSP